jgi:flavin-dependent dehydrogenase
VVGGEIAGRVAAEAIDKGDLHYLENYEMEWHETFGNFLSYGAIKREFLEENWNKSEVDFEGLIRRTWVGFKEYYQNRRKIPLNPPCLPAGRLFLRGKNPSLTKSVRLETERG